MILADFPTRRLHPLTALLFFAVWSTVILQQAHWLPLLFLFTGTAAGLCLCTGWRAFQKTLLPLGGFAVVLFLLNGAFSWLLPPETPALFDPISPLDRSIGNSIQLLSIFALTGIFQTMIAPAQLATWLSRLTPRAGTILLLSLSALPRRIQSFERLSLSLSHRGITPTGKKGFRRIPESIPFWKAFLTESLTDSIEVAAAAHARGFGVGKPTRFPTREWHQMDFQILTTSCLALPIFFLPNEPSVSLTSPQTLSALLAGLAIFLSTFFLSSHRA